MDAYAERVGRAGATVHETSGIPATAPATPAVLGDAERETRIPIRGVRKHTAAAMVQSAFTAPHVTVFHTVDVTATMDLLSSLATSRTQRTPGSAVHSGREGRVPGSGPDP